MKDQEAIDRITETENLTDGLEDEDADWLVQWGISHVHELIGGVSDDEAAGRKLNDLMAVMRKLNQIAADRADKPAGALASDVQAFMALYAKTFGHARAMSASEPQHAAAALSAKSAQETMQFLINLVKPASAQPTPGSADKQRPAGGHS